VGGRRAAVLGRGGEEGWLQAGRDRERRGVACCGSAGTTARSRCSGREESENGDFCFFLAKREMSATMRMIVLGCSGGHQGPPTQGSKRTDALPIAFPFNKRVA
jgi:hypothetical protein